MWPDGAYVPPPGMPYHNAGRSSARVRVSGRVVRCGRRRVAAPPRTPKPLFAAAIPCDIMRPAPGSAQHSPISIVALRRPYPASSQLFSTAFRATLCPEIEFPQLDTANWLYGRAAAAGRPSREVHASVSAARALARARRDLELCARDAG